MTYQHFLAVVAVWTAEWIVMQRLLPVHTDARLDPV